MNWVVFGDDDKIKTTNKYVNWIKLTHLLSYFSLNLRAPLWYICLYSRNLGSVFIYKYNILFPPIPPCMLCTLMSQILSLLTHTLVHMWYGVKPHDASPYQS